mmetsp:Transcript_54394/g.156407  ORF Transcript_54394/g.156407 Transcript_54394/m.156407 type:complete len:383 (+) Transcript_54394:353-1501(+)
MGQDLGQVTPRTIFTLLDLVVHHPIADQARKYRRQARVVRHGGRLHQTSHRCLDSCAHPASTHVVFVEVHAARHQVGRILRLPATPLDLLDEGSDDELNSIQHGVRSQVRDCLHMCARRRAQAVVRERGAADRLQPPREAQRMQPDGRQHCAQRAFFFAAPEEPTDLILGVLHGVRRRGSLPCQWREHGLQGVQHPGRVAAAQAGGPAAKELVVHARLGVLAPALGQKLRNHRSLGPLQHRENEAGAKHTLHLFDLLQAGRRACLPARSAERVSVEQLGAYPSGQVVRRRPNQGEGLLDGGMLVEPTGCLQLRVPRGALQKLLHGAPADAREAAGELADRLEGFARGRERPELREQRCCSLSSARALHERHDLFVLLLGVLR